jgi:hypothetical protein
MSEQRVRELLRDAPLDDAGARARSLEVVRAAYRELEPQPRRRSWLPVLAVAACVLAAVVITATAGSPGDAVARWVRTVLGAGHEDARPALVRIPGGGRLLAGSWVVSPDGSRRRLGGYDGTSWSPHGRFVVAWRDGELSAVEPGGTVRWSLARPGTVRVARWAPFDGYRIAYLVGDELRVVNGDGTSDHRYGAARAVAPAWRPGAGHVLAYVDARARVRVVAVDSRRELWRTAPVRGVRELAWSPDGRLLVATARALVIRGPAGRVIARHTLPAGLVADDVAWAPRGNRIAVVRRDPAARRSEVVLLRPGGRARLLFTDAGRFGTLAWSPSGRRLLVPWREADQWLFLAPEPGGRTTAVANIARQFGPRAGRPAFAGSVEWCCAG